jgi:hypothetical protein
MTIILSNDKYIEYRRYSDQEYYPLLKYSSYLFIIPTLCGFYLKKYTISFAILFVWITSILRWTFTQNLVFQYIDHNYVKIIFFVSLYMTILHIIDDNKNNVYYIFLIGILISVFFLFTIAVILDYNMSNKNIIFHMIMHLYSIFGFTIAAILFDHYLPYKLNIIHYLI